VVLRSGKARNSYKVLKSREKRLLELPRPRAKKGDDGDVAYVIGLDIMLVHANDTRIQLI
jgi:hypothetical protein